MTIRGLGRPAGGFYQRPSDGKVVPSASEVAKLWGDVEPIAKWSAMLAVEARDAGASKWEAIGEPIRVRDAAGAHGSRIHEAVESVWRGKEPEAPEDDALAFDMLTGLRRVLQWFRERPYLVFLGFEIRCVNEHFGGAIDWVCLDTRTGEIVIGDLKTGSVYEQAAIQLGGYALLYKSRFGIRPSAAFVLEVPRKDPRAPVRSTFFEGPWLHEAVRGFQLAGELYYRSDRLLHRLGRPGRLDQKRRAAAAAERTSR